MADWDDVRRIVEALPEVREMGGSGGRHLKWVIKDKLVVWERPLRRADLAALGDRAPTGNILAAWVPDRVDKEALVSDPSDIYFTTPHFDGWDIVLVVLDRIPVDELEELIVDSWLRQAPKRVAKTYLESHGLETGD
ncbi:MAG: MmcQ/YjbR family DNA-binding protein [Actinobacteria bacterium]|nr:MmcQ/YjbR family DNA-binding protein [Actinomycetota bacterium]